MRYKRIKIHPTNCGAMIVLWFLLVEWAIFLVVAKLIQQKWTCRHLQSITIYLTSFTKYWSVHNGEEILNIWVEAIVKQPFIYSCKLDKKVWWDLLGCYLQTSLNNNQAWWAIFPYVVSSFFFTVIFFYSEYVNFIFPWCIINAIPGYNFFC